MSLKRSKGRPYKAYVKKLENGFGIKTINTRTGVENIIVITADSNKSSCSDEKIVESQCQILRPLMRKFSEETVSAALSVQSVNKPSFVINKVLAQLEPYLRETKPDIAGFHIFEESNTKSSPNVQKTSIIFVANTELARKKGVYFNIPGNLMNIFFVDGQNKEGKIKFKADPVVKPLTIVVSDYVLHINICYDLPSKTQSKTVGTQTKKRYVLSSSVDEDKPIYKIESFLPSDLQVKPEQKFTQTDGSILTDEFKLSQDNCIQTVFFEDQISNTSMSSATDKKSYSCDDKSVLNTEEDNNKTTSFEYCLKQSIDYENSQDSFTSYDSHARLKQTIVLNHLQDGKVHKAASVENEDVNHNIESLTTADRKNEKKTLTLFDISSNYNTKTTSSDDAFENVQPKYYSNAAVCTSTTSASSQEDRSETSVKTAHSGKVSNQVRNIVGNSNVSMKQIKERLNKATLSLQQLYSLIDLLEKNSDKRSRTPTAVHTEREILKNDNEISSRTGIFVTNQAKSEEFTSSNYSSDVSIYYPEKSLTSYRSTSTTDSDKPLVDYGEKSSLDILCERCGSFHSDVGFDGVCKISEEKNIKLLRNNSSQYSIKSDCSKYQENLCKNIKNVSAVTNTEMGSCDDLSDEKLSHLETNIEDSTMCCNQHNYSTSHETNKNKKSKKHKDITLSVLGSDKEDLGNGVSSMTTKDRNMVINAKESYQMVVDHNYKHSFSEINNCSRSDIEKSSGGTFINRKEFELDDISNVDNDSGDFNKVLKVNNPSNNTIVSNGNISEECVKSSAESNDSINKFTGLHEDNNKHSSHSTNSRNLNVETVCDTKEIEEYVTPQSLKGSNTVFLFGKLNSFIPSNTEKNLNSTTLGTNKTKGTENGKLFFFSGMRDIKSRIALKKSLKSCNHNTQLVVNEDTTVSRPTNNQLKIKNLCSGDQLRPNKLCKTSSSFEERINTVGLFNNQYSSSRTLHIVPSTQDLLQCQVGLFEDRGHSMNDLERVQGKSPSFEKRNVNSLGKLNNKGDGNSACTTRYSSDMKFENHSVANNKTDLKASSHSKTKKITKQNKYAKNKKGKSKHKRSKWFCFFV